MRIHKSNGRFLLIVSLILPGVLQFSNSVFGVSAQNCPPSDSYYGQCECSSTSLGYNCDVNGIGDLERTTLQCKDLDELRDEGEATINVTCL